MKVFVGPLNNILCVYNYYFNTARASEVPPLQQELEPACSLFPQDLVKVSPVE
jgi:hypothetical protein